MDCGICGEEAEANGAVIEVDSAEAAARGVRFDEWEFERQKEAGGIAYFSSAADIPGEPRLEWQWTHRDCGPERGYWFDADRMTNSAEALGWTLHLADKTWWKHTAWSAFIRKLGFVKDA